jgi:hypothetical protein
MGISSLSGTSKLLDSRTFMVTRRLGLKGIDGKGTTRLVPEIIKVDRLIAPF